jgi:hypothetical protein
MEVYRSANTCSAAEIGHLLEEGSCGSLTTALRNCVREALDTDRHFTVAYVADYQLKNKDLVAALKSNNFKKVGSYAGNSADTVHVYAHGLRVSRKSSKK